MMDIWGSILKKDKIMKEAKVQTPNGSPFFGLGRSA